MAGTLYGLGIGPGDPELITLKARRILRSVPVVAYPAPEGGESLARAIAAPQLGRRVRLVAFDLGRGPRALINPRIVARSEESFTLWDDCFSFPELLVRVRRARSVTIEFDDERGHPQVWKALAPAESDLFQHELDHLDGKLYIALGQPHNVQPREKIALYEKR